MRTNPKDKKKSAATSPGTSVVIGEKMGNNVILEPINFV